MITFFKRLERTRNIIILLFAIVMVVSLIVTGALFNDSPTGVVDGSAVLAKVDDEEITAGEAFRLQQSGDSRPVGLIIETLIDQKVTRSEAKRLGLWPSDAEVASEIARLVRQPDGTVLDKKQYENFAVNQAGSVIAYEDLIRNFIAERKLKAYVSAGVTVSEAEVLTEYKRKNTRFDVSYVSIATEDVAKSIKPSEEEITTFYNQNKNKYFISSDQRRVSMVFVETAKVKNVLKITDVEVRTEFDGLSIDRKRKGAESQQIVIRVPKNGGMTVAMEKAREILLKVKGPNKTVGEKEFAEAVKLYSEDARTASAGGRVSFSVSAPRAGAKPGDNPLDTLLKMSEGEVAGPIVSGETVLILRKNKDVTKTFDEMKAELTASLKDRKADTAAAALSQKIRDRLVSVKDSRKVAEGFVTEAGASLSDMVFETSYLKPGDSVPRIGVNKDFEGALATLKTNGDVTEKVRVQNGFAVAILLDKKAPRNRELSEVREQVTKDVATDLANKRIGAIAREIAAGAVTAGDISRLAAAKGFKAEEQKEFSLELPLGQGVGAVSDERISDAIFGLNEGAVSKSAIEVNGRWFVVGVTKRQEPDMSKFASEKDSLIAGKLVEKQSEFFNDYLAEQRRRREESGAIKIYKEEIAKLEQSLLPQQPQ